MKIHVIDIKEGWIWNTVVFEANEYTDSVYETILGNKIFWMNAGDIVSLKMSKKDHWVIGQGVRSLSWLITTTNQFKFKWAWYYGDKMNASDVV